MRIVNNLENTNNLGQFDIVKEVVLRLVKDTEVDKSSGPDGIYPMY